MLNGGDTNASRDKDWLRFWRIFVCVYKRSFNTCKNCVEVIRKWIEITRGKNVCFIVKKNYELKQLTYNMDLRTKNPATSIICGILRYIIGKGWPLIFFFTSRKTSYSNCSKIENENLSISLRFRGF